MRGNSEWYALHGEPQELGNETGSVPDLIHSLRFGDGALLKDGTGDHASGRTLKGRYIVRVGWDDVRGWFTEVGVNNNNKEDIGSLTNVGWYADWNGALGRIPHR